MQHTCTLSAVSHSSIVKVLIPHKDTLRDSVLRPRFLARLDRLSCSEKSVNREVNVASTLGKRRGHSQCQVSRRPPEYTIGFAESQEVARNSSTKFGEESWKPGGVPFAHRSERRATRFRHISRTPYQKSYGAVFAHQLYACALYACALYACAPRARLLPWSRCRMQNSETRAETRSRSTSLVTTWYERSSSNRSFSREPSNL
jgi:hypothetical protein